MLHHRCQNQNLQLTRQRLCLLRKYANQDFSTNSPQKKTAQAKSKGEQKKKKKMPTVASKKFLCLSWKTNPQSGSAAPWRTPSIWVDLWSDFRCEKKKKNVYNVRVDHDVQVSLKPLKPFFHQTTLFQHIWRIYLSASLSLFLMMISETVFSFYLKDIAASTIWILLQAVLPS